MNRTKLIFETYYLRLAERDYFNRKVKISKLETN